MGALMPHVTLMSALDSSLESHPPGLSSFRCSDVQGPCSPHIDKLVSPDAWCPLMLAMSTHPTFLECNVLVCIRSTPHDLIDQKRSPLRGSYQGYSCLWLAVTSMVTVCCLPGYDRRASGGCREGVEVVILGPAS